MSIAFKNKKKVIQTLQHPRLRKIRYEFRTLLRLLYDDQQKEFYDKVRKIDMDKSLSYEERKSKRIPIIREQQRIAYEYRTFPIGCGVCANREKNLVYLPNRVQWLYVDCYKFSHKNFPKDYP
ncbi:MAG: hypothetical protein P8Y70_01135 [Candidatus Lokiarchaeota archaeon]